MDLTPGLPEEPVADNLLRQAERHDENAQGEVGQCQGCHKPILDTLDRERDTDKENFEKSKFYRGRIDEKELPFLLTCYTPKTLANPLLAYTPTKSLKRK